MTFSFVILTVELNFVVVEMLLVLIFSIFSSSILLSQFDFFSNLTRFGDFGHRLGDLGYVY